MSNRSSAAALLGGAIFLIATLSGCGGAPGEPATPAPNDESPSGTADTEGAGSTLDILSQDPTAVLLDGKPLGKTPITRHTVTPGSHEVTFVDPTLGNRTMVITVQPGEAATVKADAPPKRVQLTSPEPGEAAE